MWLVLQQVEIVLEDVSLHHQVKETNRSGVELTGGKTCIHVQCVHVDKKKVVRVVAWPDTCMNECV